MSRYVRVVLVRHLGHSEKIHRMAIKEKKRLLIVGDGSSAEVLYNEFYGDCIQMYNVTSKSNNDIVTAIEQYGIELIVLAETKWICPRSIWSKINVINVHPTLLPIGKVEFGDEAISAGYHNRYNGIGITIHRVSDEVNGGEIIKQIKYDGCSIHIPFGEYKARIKELEEEWFKEVVTDELDRSYGK